MERLWAPWRMKYIESGDLDSDGCFLCDKLAADPSEDEENLILHRGNNAFVLMNLYPYNNGHLMVAPKRHTGEFTELHKDELAEMMYLTQICVDALKQKMEAQGINIGFNIGRVAGAGCVDHIHLHIVPRWNGDTNFMPIIGDTKIMSEALNDTYRKLLPEFANLK